MRPEEIFSDLGFNALESEVYVALVKNGPQTAYKIAKQIGKPNANVYNAVERLAREGAIEVTATAVKVCKAIPIGVVVKQLQEAYKYKAEKAVKTLSMVEEISDSEGIYRLQTKVSVFQRAASMLERASSVVVIDAFPVSLAKIAPQLNKLAAAGIKVYVQAYSPVKLHRKISVIVPSIGKNVLSYWEAEQLNIAVDGKEILLALFDTAVSNVIQATYSNNLYLSCILHSGILSEHKVHQFSQASGIEEVNKIRKDQAFFLNSKVPGLDILFNQYKQPT